MQKILAPLLLRRGMNFFPHSGKKERGGGLMNTPPPSGFAGVLPLGRGRDKSNSNSPLITLLKILTPDP